MNQNTPSARDGTTPLTSSFDRYLQDKGKGRGGDGGNYRRNAARELDWFAEWAAGGRGNDGWTGIVPDDANRDPTFGDLDERVFREYARHLAGDRGLKQNTVQTYYRYISAWCGWCVNEGYLEAHYAQRASAMAPLPEDDGRKPGATSRLGRPNNAMPSPATSTNGLAMPSKRTRHFRWILIPSTSSERAAALKAARDRALVFVLAYTAVRVGELLRDPNDPRRRGVRWEEISLDDGSMDVYRKKQQWDAASLPDPVISPLRSYRRRLGPTNGAVASVSDVRPPDSVGACAGRTGRSRGTPGGNQ